MRRLSGLISLTLCLGFLPCVAFALGLGNIHLHSALGQKLDADIAIVGDQSADGLKVDLASPEQFKKAGVNDSPALRTLKFKVVRGESGYHIHVTSSEPIREPFLTFLVSAEWPSGQVLREYTVLLDPPNYAAAAPAVAAPATAANRASTAAPAAATQPRAPSRAPVETAPAPSSEPLHAGDNYGTIRRGETLWGIASKLRAGTDIGVDQMMIALYRANPEAFSGNINRMKAGYTLRVPEAASIRRIDRQSAIAAVKRANREFMADRAAPEPAAPVAAADNSAGNPSGTRLQLVAPGSDAAESDAEPGVGADAAAAVAELKQQLAQAEQQADDAAKKNAALASQVDDLKQQLAKNKRLLAVKDKQLSQLQNQARKQNAAAPAPSDGGKTDWMALATKPATLAGVLAVIVLILGGLVILRQRRAAAAAATDEVTITPIVDESPADDAGQAAAAVAGAPTDDSAEDIAIAEQQEAVGDADETAMVAAVMPTVDEPAGIELPGADDAAPADPVAEADFHLDYGLYDQAAEIIRKAIEADPERDELVIKLFKIYFAAGDTTAYPVAAQEFADWGADHPAEWDEICAMGRELVPQEPLFAAGFLDTEAASETADSATGTGVETATDIAVDEGDDTEIEDPRDQPLDLDLESLGLGSEDATAVETEAEPETEAVSETAPTAEDEAEAEDGGFDLSDLTLPSDIKEGDRLVDTQTEFEDAIKELSEFVDTNFPENEAGDEDKRTAPIELEFPGAGDEATAPATDTGGDDDFGEEGDGLDELDTKLDLARAYMDMGDPEGARSILEEVIEEGGPEHQNQARSLLERVG